MSDQYPEVNDLDELFGFNEARKRAEEAKLCGSKIATNFIPYRIFLNNVDEFNERHIASFVVDQVFGSKRNSTGTIEEVEEEYEYDEGEMEETETKEVTEEIPHNYEIIGSLRKSYHKPTEDITFTLQEEDDDFMSKIMKCGFVVYDITQDPQQIPKALATLEEMHKSIENMKELGPKTFKKMEELRVFILISTVMTWAFTKPIDPYDPTMPFTEADYKKRKAHPNFKEHIDCEKQVIQTGRKNPEKLKTYVVCSGIIYGYEEEDLAFLFRLAWNNEKELPIFRPGKNVLPFIHINDLARVLYVLMEMCLNAPQYILAVEQTQCSFEEMVKALSKALGNGRTKNVSKEEAFLYKDVTQDLYDRYTINIVIEPSSIIDPFQIEWRNEMNIAENMSAIVKEYKKCRCLVPVRIVIHGPPAVGKTRIGKQLAEYYGAHYTNIKKLIDDTLKEAYDNIEKLSAEVESTEEFIEEEEEEEVIDVDALREKIRSIEGPMAEGGNGKLPMDQVIEMLRDFLLSNKCLNQGYVLDGFPKITQQAAQLYETEDSGDEEDVDNQDEEGRNRLLPDYVISLEATDDFLCNRIMALPEREIRGTHYEEETMLRRLAEFRANNNEDNTVLNFFDEMEIHPILLNTMDDLSENMDNIMDVLLKRIGTPVKFALTLTEEDELILSKEEKEKKLEWEKHLKNEELEKQAVSEHQCKMEKWTELLEQLQMEEEKILAVQGEPLRNYLIKFVFPILGKGLVEAARIRPCDPVDFLAEYLFKENPEGHMFDPAYTQEGQRILEDFEKTLQKYITDGGMTGEN
ncbi:hypothetical protein FQA39_LY06956 [Lamprigera yunnana]|nr:hypothetical protein FQA39_LY06956 [Lamprigera yunnana]